MEEKAIERKKEFYTKKYGENALREIILEIEKNTYFGSSDYIEIIYEENGTPKRLKVMGELTNYWEYLAVRVNLDHDITISRKENGKYYPLLFYKKGEYL